jgi:hypothetical protein
VLGLAWVHGARMRLTEFEFTWLHTGRAPPSWLVGTGVGTTLVESSLL